MKKFLIALLVLLAFGFMSCMPVEEARSNSGVGKATAVVKPQANGMTIEQQNIYDRLALENKPGAVQHLYIISAYTGQVILYSTVKGKVTSSGKRLTPPDVYEAIGNHYNGFGVDINGVKYLTKYVLGDDGTYGDSMQYLYWWDVQGVYHQEYVSGSIIVHVSDQPLAGVKPLMQQVEVTVKK